MMLRDYVIATPDPALGAAVQSAIDFKTKPPGSLGRIEALALQMALAQGTERPVADPARLFIFAGDHGIVAEGVSAWPQEVTAQMVLNFLAGGAASTVFASGSSEESCSGTNSSAVALAVTNARRSSNETPSLTRTVISWLPALRTVWRRTGPEAACSAPSTNHA